MNTQPNNIFGVPIEEWTHDGHRDHWTHWSGVTVAHLFLVKCPSEEHHIFYEALQQYIDSLSPVERETRRARLAAAKEAHRFYGDVEVYLRQKVQAQPQKSIIDWMTTLPDAINKRLEESRAAIDAWETWRQNCHVEGRMTRSELTALMPLQIALNLLLSGIVHNARLQNQPPPSSAADAIFAKWVEEQGRVFVPQHLHEQDLPGMISPTEDWTRIEMNSNEKIQDFLKGWLRAVD